MATFFKLILLPIITAAILAALDVSPDEIAIGVLMVGSPTAAVSFIMASQMKGDVDLARSIIVVTTLGSILTYSSMLYFLQLILPIRL